MVGNHVNLTTNESLRIKQDGINLMLAYDSMHVSWYCANVYVQQTTPFQFVEITEAESLTVDGFIAQIGGQLGLMLGASVLSIVQAIVLTVHLLFFGNKQDKTPKTQPIVEYHHEDVDTVQFASNEKLDVPAPIDTADMWTPNQLRKVIYNDDFQK